MSSRIARLMAARVVVAVGVLGIALVVIGAGHEGAAAAERGLYATMAAAFVSTVAFALLLPRVREVRRLGLAQLALDAGLVTALVVFSGGSESIFGFLYLPIVVYGALLFGRGGAYLAAGLSSGSHALGIGIARGLGASVALRGAEPVATELALALWGLHSGALLLVALLASTLARELRVAGEHLDARTSALETLRSLHERTVECLTSGLATIDGEGCVTSFNREAEHITGRSREDVLGRPLQDVLPGALDGIGESPAGAGGQRRRVHFEGADGEPRHLGLAASTLRDAEGVENGRVVIFQDVTRVVAMERDLARTQRLAGVGQLAADMAHEIRNPLAAISGSVEILRQSLGERPELPEGRRLMDIVLREIDRLDALLTDFLQYARPAPAKQEAVALDALIHEIAEMCQAALPDAIHLEVQVPEGLCVEGDPTQVRQVLWNLVSNAQQAVGEPGRIRLHAAPGGRPQEPGAGSRNGTEEGSPGVCIRVEDDGPGIAPENLERIFDPFFTTKVGGTGLGLATVHRIVESHGGAIAVESGRSGGSTFRVWWPAPAMAAGREEESG
ncbi:MAG: ATP-binding protein [Myxococcota bacterium]|nr:ATP-binding protein [Myxococcota bacterium]